MTDVRHQLLHPDGTPRVRLQARARLAAPAFLGEAEITGSAETFTDLAGVFAFSLPPSSALTPPTQYVITWGTEQVTVTVPAATGPVNLSGVPIVVTTLTPSLTLAPSLTLVPVG